MVAAPLAFLGLGVMGSSSAMDLSKINFEALIESYSNGIRNIEQLFKELLKLSNSLNEEQERHVRENLSEEELHSTKITAGSWYRYPRGMSSC